MMLQRSNSSHPLALLDSSITSHRKWLDCSPACKHQDHKCLGLQKLGLEPQHVCVGNTNINWELWREFWTIWFHWQGGTHLMQPCMLLTCTIRLPLHHSAAPIAEAQTRLMCCVIRPLVSCPKGWPGSTGSFFTLLSLIITTMHTSCSILRHWALAPLEKPAR